ncbi:MAG: hypothetical protein FWD68_05070 [Alphaproteobacteria bacterium]|nr:hypothetical protein [Alphaproteobacteria bacterium]
MNNASCFIHKRGRDRPQTGDRATAGGRGRGWLAPPPTASDFIEQRGMGYRVAPTIGVLVWWPQMGSGSAFILGIREPSVLGDGRAGKPDPFLPCRFGVRRSVTGNGPMEAGAVASGSPLLSGATGRRGCAGRAFVGVGNPPAGPAGD